MLLKSVSFLLVPYLPPRAGQGPSVLVVITGGGAPQMWFSDYFF